MSIFVKRITIFWTCKQIRYKHNYINILKTLFLNVHIYLCQRKCNKNTYIWIKLTVCTKLEQMFNILQNQARIHTYRWMYFICSFVHHFFPYVLGWKWFKFVLKVFSIFTASICIVVWCLNDYYLLTLT